ncbi:hypothetical protein Tco_1362928 [Tanacetum coccineum]
MVVMIIGQWVKVGPHLGSAMHLELVFAAMAESGPHNPVMVTGIKSIDGKSDMVRNHSASPGVDREGAASYYALLIISSRASVRCSHARRRLELSISMYEVKFDARLPISGGISEFECILLSSWIRMPIVEHRLIERDVISNTNTLEKMRVRVFECISQSGTCGLTRLNDERESRYAGGRMLWMQMGGSSSSGWRFWGSVRPH